MGTEFSSYILIETDVYFESGKKEISDPKNLGKNAVTEVGKINTIFTAIGTGITPQEKDGKKLLKTKINGKIFNDLVSFQAIALAQLINSGGPTNIILVGAINPRRSDDFNSYNTMTQIAAKIVANCDNTAAECN